MTVALRLIPNNQIEPRRVNRAALPALRPRISIDEGSTPGGSPQSRPAGVSADAASGAAPHAHPVHKRILLVEDETVVREVVRRMLESLGYQPLIAANAPEALELLKHEDVDLLLSDVIMPDMRGPELFTSARGDSPELDALFVSGYSEDVLAEVPLHEPGVGFLSKPFTITELGDALAALLTRD